MTNNNRDRRNFQKGYQEALLDIYIAILNEGEEGALEWIRNNNSVTSEKFDKAHAEYFARIEQESLDMRE